MADVNEEELERERLNKMFSEVTVKLPQSYEEGLNLLIKSGNTKILSPLQELARTMEKLIQEKGDVPYMSRYDDQEHNLKDILLIWKVN